MKSADPGISAAERADHHRRRRVFLLGTLAGWGLAAIVGALLIDELKPIRNFFVPLSGPVSGLAALFAWVHTGASSSAGEGWKQRRLASAALAVAAFLFLLLYARFTVRAGGHVFIVGWSRSQDCNCPPSAIDAVCLPKVGLSVSNIRACWPNRWVIELALTLSYLLALRSLGAVVGLLKLPQKPAPAPPGYLDFDLWLDHRGGSTYRAKAWSAAAGYEATVTFTLPAGLAGGGPLRFGPADSSRGGPPAGASASAGPGEMGAELFQTVFQGEMLKAFQGCLDKAKAGPGLRIRLRLNDAPELVDLPWEYLNEPEGRGFLALSSRTPVVRYLELSESLQTLAVEPPLRILVVLSTPRGYQELVEADEEWRQLGAALQELRDAGAIEVERLEPPTLEALDGKLRDGGPFHILHFVGHGGFSEISGEGVLVFEDGEGHGVPVAGQHLAYLLQDHPSLRLAVLNACNGARASREDTFAGTAQVLVQHGMPAVVAMQSEVMDRTACRFAEKFYQSLAEGLPVDACVGEVRKTLASEGNPEWGTPVLYLRATDGRLFTVEGGSRRG